MTAWPSAYEAIAERSCRRGSIPPDVVGAGTLEALHPAEFSHPCCSTTWRGFPGSRYPAPRRSLAEGPLGGPHKPQGTRCRAGAKVSRRSWCSREHAVKDKILSVPTTRFCRRRWIESSESADPPRAAVIIRRTRQIAQLYTARMPSPEIREGRVTVKVYTTTRASRASRWSTARTSRRAPTSAMPAVHKASAPLSFGAPRCAPSPGGGRVDLVAA